MNGNPYKRLAERLDALPNGFPPTEDGAEIRLLAKLFTAEEANLAAQLRVTWETPSQIAERIGGDPEILARHLKGMARRGLIAWGKTDKGVAYGLLPFVVGIYEFQIDRLDAELAWLFEDYYQKAFGRSLEIQPQVHRVIPVGEAVPVGLDIQPYESAADIVNQAQAWGQLDCICRSQKALIGDPCVHPRDVCMALSKVPNAFDGNAAIKSLTRQEALGVLQRSAAAGLVHSVSNNQHGNWYICNCCTCSCAILRGMAELGIANVVARSAFVNQVDEALCLACEDCLDACQFGALSVDGVARVTAARCVGCGVCILTCPEDALSLARRPDREILQPPETIRDWGMTRAINRGLDVTAVL